ncbi:tetratricopeptide repeat protein [Shimia sp. SDUM112013]|uniref:tetratricopeptide repeat protein n=1 Tax=Shimia sp. SDUM112013 TaxID=3136160 RepID=UPI0032EF1E0E
MKYLAFVLFATPVVASQCPPPPDHAEAQDALIAQVQVAPDPATAQDLSNQLWELWADAPDEVAQEILDRGMRKRAGWNLLGALEDFNTLIAYCPDYAEGYNQRAFVSFLNQDYAGALPDLDRTLALSPRHIGALSGKALVFIGLGRDAEAQDMLARALELNPWLPERDLYRPPTVQEPEGDDL